MNEKLSHELRDDDLEMVNGGAVAGNKGKKVRVMGLKAEGGSGNGFMFACQNPVCGKAFIISDLNADEYECPYCHKIHVSCG